MIDEGRKNTAFDAMEAMMRLSDMYRLTNDSESVSFRVSGSLAALYAFFGHWQNFEYVIDKDFRIQIDDFNFGDTFSDLFLHIEKEIDRVSEHNIKREDETA